ncbi:MAG: XtrA/YqaO family protein [Sporolactobacillus sp.]|uniref:XtrA/YqaO family protein n=1 Tax=Sporolactobacillus sp. STSJ-5 TaxID=2965076 RepID=UPI00210201E7|nr:XtrA/YqaO family protein [Sporolactobacillus sp. STSJ-5]MCQ2009282.1 XtrA/YqaO family protein [Sporolactobacillus sp. STSJ-5]
MLTCLCIEPCKALVVVLDGVQKKSKITETVEHGLTIIETVKEKAVRKKYDEGNLY